MDDEWSLCAGPDWHLSLLFFSLSLPVVRLDKVMLCAILECLTVCHKHASKYVSTLFLATVLLHYEQTSNAPCRLVKHQSKVWSIQCVISPTPFSPCPSLLHTHSQTHIHTWLSSVSMSLPTGVRLLCKAAWMGTEITEGCLCSWFPSHFEVSSGSQEQGPQSQTRVRALGPSAMTMISTGGRGAVLTCKATCCLSCWRTLLF